MIVNLLSTSMTLNDTGYIKVFSLLRFIVL